MKTITLSVLMLVSLMSFDSAFAHKKKAGTPLYVGTKGGCNAGVITTNPRHLGCRTRLVGYVKKRVSGFPPEYLTRLYVGTTRRINAGVVSTNKFHLNGKTRYIGSLSNIRLLGGTSAPLFIGLKKNCNAGVLTTNKHHLNCPTRFVGFTWAEYFQNHSH